MKKFLSLIALIVSGLYIDKAVAYKEEACPKGCFCLNDGKYTSVNGTENYACTKGEAAQTVKSNQSNVVNCNMNIYNDLRDGVASKDKGQGYTHNLSEFSELYTSILGLYGFKDGEFVYFSECYRTESNVSSYTDRIFRCPEKYPESDSGARVLADCYKYDENGEKKHYERTSVNTSSGSGNVAANYDIANMRVLVKNLQSALGQANRVAQDLESALNTVNQGNTQSTNTSQSGSNNTPASTTSTITIQSSSGNNVSAGTTSTSSTSGGNNDSYTTATTPSSGTVSSSGKGGGTTSTIAKLSDLNPTIAGSRNTQKEAAKTWSVTFPYGDVSGIASCNDTNGTYAMAYPQYNFDNNYASSTGKYCWCKMTIPNGPSSWGGAGNTNSSSSCAASCASRCGSYTRGNSSFRTSIFSMATGSTGSSSSSSVTDPNADIKAKLQNGALSKLFGLLGGKSAVPQVGRAAVYDGVPSRGASISIAGKAANQRSATGTNDAQRSSTSDKTVRENPRGTNKSNRN